VEAEDSRLLRSGVQHQHRQRQPGRGNDGGDAEAAIAEVNSGLVAAGYYTSVVVLMDEDRERLAASALSVEKAINRLAFAARIETINTLDAYLGSLPGHGVENVRRPLINTMNLADLLPTSSIWTGSATRRARCTRRCRRRSCTA
jgi:type IV secretory pathway VirB4 component